MTIFESGETPPDLRRRRPRAAAVTEFGAALGELGLTQLRIAKLFNVSPRHVRRWQHGDRRVPPAARLVINLLVTRAISIDQIEQAAVSISARTNGSVKRSTPASLRVESAALAPAKLADPGLTTAAKVCALTPEACRWPCGDPGRPDFHFCGSPVAKGSYCEHHRDAAYVALPTSRR